MCAPNFMKIEIWIMTGKGTHIHTESRRGGEGETHIHVYKFI